MAELVDIKLLQLFDVLYDTRSVTKAADQLSVSQPTVSIWLGQLRRDLRDPLFVRTPGGMAPTPQAAALIGPCREVLESLRRIAAWEAVFDPATAQRRFRISMTDASHVTLLPRLLVALDGQRDLKVSAHSPVEITVAKARLPLAQRADYSHFAVVRTKLKWSGGVAEKR